MENTTLTPAERVALLIKKLDITTYQFGKATGISHQTLSNVLTGKNKPGLDTLQAIAKEYPAAAHFLLTGEGEPFPTGRYNEKPTATPVSEPPSETPRINSDRELVRVMTEEDMRISDTSGPPYRMRRITRTTEEEIEYLRAELLRERQAHERTRERHEADRNQNHERETLLIKRLGGKTDASADAADTNDEQPVMVAHVNHSYVEPAIEPARIVVTGFVV